MMYTDKTTSTIQHSDGLWMLAFKKAQNKKTEELKCIVTHSGKQMK